jgi:hypothetical protein
MGTEKLLKDAKKFVADTAHDFSAVWVFRPNVLIWCFIFGVVLFWI